MSDDSIIGPDGKPQVLSRPCSTCIGRVGNKMDLQPGRVRQMIRDATGPDGGGIPCHQTLSYDGHEWERPAACRWFYDHYGHLCNLYRIYERTGGFTEVDPPLDSEQEEPGHGYHEAGDY